MRIIIIIASLMFTRIVSVHAQAASSTTDHTARTHVTSDTARLGDYDLEITTEGGTMTGALELTRGSSGIAAELRAGANRPEVKSFVRDGKDYVLTAGHGNVVITYRLRFAADSLSGSFTMSTGLTGMVAGARRP